MELVGTPATDWIEVVFSVGIRFICRSSEVDWGRKLDRAKIVSWENGRVKVEGVEKNCALCMQTTRRSFD